MTYLVIINKINQYKYTVTCTNPYGAFKFPTQLQRLFSSVQSRKEFIQTQPVKVQ